MRPRVCFDCDCNLEMTIGAGLRRCPECGVDFELHELRRQRAPGEWSESVGLRHAALSLLWRSLICLPVWAGLVWLIIPVFSLAPMSPSVFGGIALVLSIPSVALGHAMSVGLTERAGFTGPILTALAAAFAVGVIIGGVELAELSRPLPGWHDGMLKYAVSLFACLWIVKKTIFDE